MKIPVLFLRIEGVAIFIAGLILYVYLKYDLLWFFMLFFSFDISILGYVLGPKVGAVTYNAVHSFVGPAILLLIGIMSGNVMCTAYSIIWWSHLGFDRMIGFGFMKPTRFGDSNLAQKKLPAFIEKRLS